MPDKQRTDLGREGAHQALADLANAQHGVVSIRQLEGLGYSRDAVSYATRTGRLHRLYRGVYAIGYRPLTWEGRCLAAVLACAPGAVASHATAAWLWELLRGRPAGAFHISAPTRRNAHHAAKKGIRLHYAPLADTDRTFLRAAFVVPIATDATAPPVRSLSTSARQGANGSWITQGQRGLVRYLSTPGRQIANGSADSLADPAVSPTDVALVDGIPVTSLARTLLDYAAAPGRTPLNRAIDRAEERGLFDLRAVDALLIRAGRHPGAGHLRRALDIYRDDPAFTRSGLERSFLELIRRSPIPNPSMNFQEGEYQLDAYWPAERFAVELDVYETHGTRAAFENDRLRQEELKLRGIESIRVTGPRLKREPRAVLKRIAMLLEQRRRQRVADLTTLPADRGRGWRGRG